MLLKSPFVASLMAFAFLARQVTGQNLTCYSSLTALNEDENLVTDLEVVRTYILCANTTFYTGFLTTSFEILGGDLPLTLRKNMHIFCGDETGSSANRCTISRGSFGLTSIPANFDPPTVNTGVIVQGVTFENAAKFAMLVGLAGEFKFIDCIYSNNRAEQSVVLLEWDGGSVANATSRNLEAATGRYSYTPVRESRQSKQVKQKERKRALQTATTLKVEFIDCVFLNNTCVEESRLGVFIIGGDGVDTTFTNCLFENNDFAVPGVNDASAYGFMIENNGFGPLAINSSCFINNKGYGNALVTTYGDEIGNMTNNYGLNNTLVWITDLECTFVALVNDSGGTFPNVECSEFDATTCARDAASPTPVPQPTAVPAPTSATVTDVPAPVAAPVTAPIAPPTPATDTPAPVSRPSAPVPSVMTLPPASSASNIRVASIIAAAAIITIMA